MDPERNSGSNPETVKNAQPVESGTHPCTRLGADLFDVANLEDTALLTWLFGSDETDSRPNSRELSPNNFHKLLDATLQVENEGAALNAINKFVDASEIEYLDVDPDAIEQTNLLQSIEIEISKFIESNQKTHRLSVVGVQEAESLVLIYNEQNLLAFAKDAAQRNPDGITRETLEIIYRYRTVVRRIQEVIEKSMETSQQKTVDPQTPFQAMAWAGRVREYGYANEGRIDSDDYRTFSDEPEEEEKQQVVIHGTEIRLPLVRPFDE